MLWLESQRVFKKVAFVLFNYVTNDLMTGPLGNSEFCFKRISHCSLPDQSLSVKYYRHAHEVNRLNIAYFTSSEKRREIPLFWFTVKTTQLQFSARY